MKGFVKVGILSIRALGVCIRNTPSDGKRDVVARKGPAKFTRLTLHSLVGRAKI